MLFGELLFSLVFVVLCLILIKYHWDKRRIYKLSWSLNGPVSLPILGDALQLLCKDDGTYILLIAAFIVKQLKIFLEILEVATKITTSYASPVKFWFGPKFVIIFTETSHIKVSTY